MVSFSRNPDVHDMVRYDGTNWDEVADFFRAVGWRPATGDNGQRFLIAPPGGLASPEVYEVEDPTGTEAGAWWLFPATEDERFGTVVSRVSDDGSGQPVGFSPT